MPTYIEKIERIENAYISYEKAPLPSNIPSPKGFIGREEELIDLRKAKTRGVTSFVLHGAGGVGKSELALQFIGEIKAEFKAHIRVDMRGLDNMPLSPKDAMLQIIRAFERNVPVDLSQQGITNLYVQFLNQNKTIIFLDNAKDRKQVEPLNNSAAFIVITSRNNFNISGGFSKEIEQMSLEDAKALLYSIAAESRFEGKADELAYLAGYMPVALLPLASLLAEDQTLEAVALAQKYSDRKERLRLADPNREDLSVEASFDLSYERLSEELRERWRKLAVFPADFDVDAMQAIWQTDAAKETRSELVKGHLLIYDANSKRSRLHDLARDYTREKLDPAELANAEELFAFHYGKLLVDRNNLPYENLKWFDDERTNIEQGFAWAKNNIDTDDVVRTLCIAYAFSDHILRLRLHPREHITWFKTGLSAIRKLNNKELNNSQLEGTALTRLGSIYFNLGESQKAIEYHEQALAIAKKNGDRLIEASTLINLGLVYGEFGETHKAIEYHEQALSLAKEIGDRESEGNALGNLGNAYFDRGETHKAIEYHEQALAIVEEIRNRRGEIGILVNLGRAYSRLGEVKKAIEYYEQALSLAREIGERHFKGNSLSNLGLAYWDLGQTQKAVEYFEQALAIAKEIGDRKSEGTALINLGGIYSDLGETHKAIEYHEQALSLAKEIGDRESEGTALVNLGIAYFKLDEKEKALSFMREGLTILEIIESPKAEIVRANLAALGNKR